MKTYKKLFEKYISDENILLSLRTAKRGDKAKRTKKRLVDMNENSDKWVDRIRQIASDFHNHDHTPKEIYDGITRKKRTIIVPSVIELVIQHMQVNILKPIILKGLYEHTYAAIPNRGAHLGKRVLEKWIKNDRKNTKYCLKVDVRHFFESIDKHILKCMLARKINDSRFLEQLYKIIDVTENGLPLGYYTSQWYANWYLQEFDHFVKQELSAKYYMRYMDDMIILGSNKRTLRKMLYHIKEYLENNLKLALKDNIRIFAVGSDDASCIDFMGFRFYSNRTTLRRSIMMKASRKAKLLSKKDSLTVHDARQMLAYLGWLSCTDTYQMYSKHIKPYVSFGALRKIISKHDRGVNKNVLQNRKR